jgi:hypothetical protein
MPGLPLDGLTIIEIGQGVAAPYTAPMALRSNRPLDYPI